MRLMGVERMMREDYIGIVFGYYQVDRVDHIGSKRDVFCRKIQYFYIGNT